MAEYEWTMYEIKVDKLCYHALKSVLLNVFSILRNLESNPSFIMQHKQRQLGQNQFDMFYKIDCCAAIHGRIWMNNVPN